MKVDFSPPPGTTWREIFSQLKKGDLPPSVNAEFWRAELNRQTFSEKAGDLWHTHKVERLLATAFKNCRQQIMLFADAVEAQTGITEDQRTLIRSMSDGLIQELGESLRSEFSFWDGSDDRESVEKTERELEENGG
jgi:hypothetical protein